MDLYRSLDSTKDGGLCTRLCSARFQAGWSVSISCLVALTWAEGLCREAGSEERLRSKARPLAIHNRQGGTTGNDAA